MRIIIFLDVKIAFFISDSSVPLVPNRNYKVKHSHLLFLDNFFCLSTLKLE
jgi:hypothetical protein